MTKREFIIKYMKLKCKEFKKFIDLEYVNTNDLLYLEHLSNEDTEKIFHHLIEKRKSSILSDKCPWCILLCPKINTSDVCSSLCSYAIEHGVCSILKSDFNKIYQKMGFKLYDLSNSLLEELLTEYNSSV